MISNPATNTSATQNQQASQQPTTPLPTTTLGNPQTGTVSNVPLDKVWQWRDGMPGEGEKPEWFDNKKYKSIEEQARAYSEAQKAISSLRQRLGPLAEGAPENYDFTKFNDNSFQLNPESENFKNLSTLLKQHNIPQAFAEKLIELHKSEIRGNSIDREAELKKLGPDAADQLTRLQQWCSSNFEPEVNEWLSQHMQTAEDINALKRIRNAMSQTPIPINGVSQNVLSSKESLLKYLSENMYQGDKLADNPTKQAEFMKRLRDFT